MIAKQPPTTFIIAVALGLAASLAPLSQASPGTPERYELPAVEEGKFLFVMDRPDYSGEEPVYRGTCYSLGEKGREEVWSTSGWYEWASNLRLSTDGRYLVRIAPNFSERIEFSENIAEMPALAIYDKGKLCASYTVTDLMKDTSKVFRASDHGISEGHVQWQQWVSLRGHTLDVTALDGTTKVIDLSTLKAGAQPEPDPTVRFELPAADGGKFLFVMHAPDFSGEKPVYRGICYALEEQGRKELWTINDWEDVAGNLQLSSDGRYLVRSSTNHAEERPTNEQIAGMPALKIYDKGKLCASFTVPDLVKDVSKVSVVHRGVGGIVTLCQGLSLRGNTLVVQASDGTTKDIDLSTLKPAP